jgi:hypothetical protein
VQLEVETFHQVATGVAAWCPPLRNARGRYSTRRAEISKPQAWDDHDVVRKVYGSLELDGFPRATLLDPSWALFRWVQMHLMFGLDYIRRYGFATSSRSQHGWSTISTIFSTLCSGRFAEASQRRTRTSNGTSEWRARAARCSSESCDKRLPDNAVQRALVNTRSRGKTQVSSAIAQLRTTNLAESIRFHSAKVGLTLK